MLSQYLRGIAAAAGDARLADGDRSRLPADTWAAAEIPAGARLEFVTDGDAGEVEIRFGVATRVPPVAETFPSGFSVWRNGEFDRLVDADANAGAAQLHVTPGRDRYTIYLPQDVVPSTVDLRAQGLEIEPSPDQPRWLAYGDSITQGWSASDPGRTYSAVAGRELGLDVWNLGFAGSARGEIPAAQMIAEMPAALISLAFGTNNWTKIPHGPRHLSAVVEDFVCAIRVRQPDTPLVVISPIVRPDAESTANVLGATLTDLREAVERTVREIAQRDRAISLLAGHALVRAEELVDGIHPGDLGHRAMAAALVPFAKKILESDAMSAPGERSPRASALDMRR